MNQLFVTSSVHHACSTLRNRMAPYKCVIFNDGELFVRLEQPLPAAPVTVITATPAPATNFLELFFLLDTLAQNNACINLVFTYFGYARQDHPKPNVARSAQVIVKCLSQFPINNTTIVHCHSDRLQQYYSYTSWIPYDLYATIAQQEHSDIIVAPDHGALAMCQELAKKVGCPVGHVEKKRPMLDQVQSIALHADVAGKHVLIVDDMISTGNTAIQAANLIMQNGALDVRFIATHNLADEQTVQRLQTSPIKHSWVTNSVVNTTRCNCLTTLDLMPSLMAHLSLS